MRQTSSGMAGAFGARSPTQFMKAVIPTRTRARWTGRYRRPTTNGSAAPIGRRGRGRDANGAKVLRISGLFFVKRWERADNDCNFFGAVWETVTIPADHAADAA